MKRLVLLSLFVLFLAGCVSQTNDITSLPSIEENNDPFIKEPRDIYHRLAGGPTFSLYIDELGRLFGWGQPTYGILAHESQPDTLYSEPILLQHYFDLEDDEKFLSIVAGGNHALALTSHHRLLAWGSNLLGQIGNHKEQEIIFNPIDITEQLNLSANETISQMFAGDYFNIILTSNHRLLGWGNNTNLELGTTSFDEDFYVWKRVTSPIDLTTYLNLSDDDHVMFLGHFYTITSRHRVIAWSDAAKKGTEFDGHFRDITEEISLDQDEYIASIFSNTNIMLTSQNRLIIPSFIEPGHQASYFLYELEHTHAFQHVKVNDGHMVMITADQVVYGFGMNTHGQLGTGDTAERGDIDFSEPNQIKFIFEVLDWTNNISLDDMWIEINLERNHTMLLTSNNLLYAWGNNTYGQLGLNDFTPRYVPTLMND